MKMSTQNKSEADVRAEVAEPFLAALGYKRDTPANIDREFRLTELRQSLAGRSQQTGRWLVRPTTDCL